MVYFFESKEDDDINANYKILYYENGEKHSIVENGKYSVMIKSDNIFILVDGADKKYLDEIDVVLDKFDFLGSEH